MGLGQRILSWLGDVWNWLTGGPAEPGETPASILARQVLSGQEKQAIEQAREEKSRDAWFRTIVDPDFGEDWQAKMQQLMLDPDSNSLVYWLAKGFFIAAGLTGAIAPWGKRWQQWVERTAQSGRLEPASAFFAFKRGDLTYDTLMNDLTEQGYSSDRIEAIISSMERYLDLGALYELWRRGNIGEDDFEKHLQAQGYTGPTIVALKPLKNLIPGPGDLVRFALREAWRDDVAAKWGYDADFVPEFQEWMEKQGYGGEWPKRFWRAHWELPSITLGIEMVHRGIISEGEFEELLRISDIPAGWRPRIMKAIYTPFTRVDARRMYGLGVLDENGLYQAYRDIGFNHEKALNMVEFTIRYEEDADRELAKADVLDGYRKKLLNRDQAIAYLSRFGYRRENAEFYLAKEDLKEIQEIKDQYLTSYKANYVEGVWDLAELSSSLNKLALPAAESSRYIELWTIERERRIERPTTAQTLSFFLDSIITERQTRDELDKRGFLPIYIDWFITSSEEAKRKREEAKSAEEQVISLSTTKAPSKAELRTWWLTGIITEIELRERLKKVGYSDEDIDNYIIQWEAEEQERIDRESEAEVRRRESEKRYPTKTDLKAFLAYGFIDADEMRQTLIDQGFGEYWAERYVAAAVLEIIGEE